MIIQTGGRIKLDISNGEFKFSAVNSTSTYSGHEAELWNTLIKLRFIQLHDELNDNIKKLNDAQNKYNEITKMVDIMVKKAESGPSLPHGVIANMEKLKMEEELKKLKTKEELKKLKTEEELKKLKTEEELAENDFNNASSALWSDIESRGKEYAKWLHGKSGRSYFNKSMNALITDIAKNGDHAKFMHDKLLTIFQERHKVDNYKSDPGHVYFTEIFKTIFFNFCEKRYKIVYELLEKQLKTVYESFRKKLSASAKEKRAFIRQFNQFIKTETDYFNQFIKTETEENFSLESLDIFEKDGNLKIDEMFTRLAKEYCEGEIGGREPHPPIFTAVNIIIHYYNEHLKPRTTSEKQTTSEEQTTSDESSQSQNQTKTRKNIKNKVQEDAKNTRTQDEGKSNEVKEEGGRHIRAKSKKKLIIDNKKRKTTRKNIKPIK